VAALQGRLGDPSAVFLVASPEEGKVAMAAAVSPAAVAGGLQVLNTALVHLLPAWALAAGRSAARPLASPSAGCLCQQNPRARRLHALLVHGGAASGRC